MADKQGGNAGLAPTSTSPPAWTGFHVLRVSDIRRESADVLSYVLETQDQSPLPEPLPGQFIAVKLQVDGRSAAVLRTYSMSGPPGVGTYRISVKRATGVGSQYLHDHVRAGDLLQVSALRGSFTLAHSATPVVLLSAGIGATPVLAMLHALAAAGEESKREIWWCYGARNGREHPFAVEARSLLSRLPQSHSVVAYSRPDDADQLGRDYDARGHLDLPFLKQCNLPRGADFYLCGPAAFLAEMVTGLQLWGVHGSCIHTEVFGAGPALAPGIASSVTSAPHEPVGAFGTGPNVSFARSGLTVPWNPRFGSILELAEACDVPVRWSCRVGVCHTCESGMIGGAVRYSPEPLDQPSDGNVLLCCSTPASEIEVDL